jgi:simple sugar transport system permease protein
MEYYLTIIQIMDSTIRLSIPLIFAALAGLFSERSGIVDIGLDGKMLAAAFVGAAMAYTTQSAWIGLIFAIITSISLALVHGYASISQRGDQVVSGLAINFIAAGGTIILGQAWFQQSGQTPQLASGAKFQTIILPFAESLKDIPIFGPIYHELLSGHYLLTYVAFALVPLCWWILFRTRFGLRLRAVGENPGAVDTAGISVYKMRYLATIFCGALCGLSGAYLSMAVTANFSPNMTAGKGYIALAALIFAKWKPRAVMYPCLLFGFLDAIQFRLQGKEFPVVGEIPVQLTQALPYILTVILLAGFIGKARAPKAIGRPYIKER